MTYRPIALSLLLLTSCVLPSQEVSDVVASAPVGPLPAPIKAAPTPAPSASVTVLPLVQGGSETRSFGKPQLSLEYTFDTRGFNTLNLTGSTPLRYQWNLWGLIDLHSSDGGPTAERIDTSRYFIELDLKRKLWNNVGVIFEVNDFAGDENVLGRAGGFYLVQADWLSEHDAKLYFKVFPYETDGHGSQASFSFAKRFPGFAEDRWSIGGFLDANLDAGPLDDDTIIVTETQIRYEFMDGLNLFAEIRHNDGLADEDGVGFGLQGLF